jgi:hypothetical protein
MAAILDASFRWMRRSSRALVRHPVCPETVIKHLHMLLVLGLVIAVEGCCGGVKTPEARKSFITAFNDKKNGCEITSTSADHTKISMT